MNTSIWGHRTRRSLMAVVLCWLFCFGLVVSCDGDDPSSAPVVQPTGDGDVYYVAPSGNDAYSGDYANPWQTIQHAADSVLPGDIVYIRAGTYVEAVVFTVSGIQNQWITFMAAPDEDVTIQSLQINEGVSFLNISSLTVQRNNIFAFNCREALGGPTGLYLGAGVQLVSEGYNLFWSQEDEEILAEFVSGEQEFSRTAILDGTWAAVTGQGQGDRAADPLFVAGWPDVDLHLRANSPAVDHGDATGAPSDDLSGAPRPQGGAWDIGAYER